MTETVITETVRNGVDTATMFATLDAIKAQPEIAQFRFRARNRWLGGAHNRSRASPRSCWAPTPALTRPSICSTRSPRA